MKNKIIILILMMFTTFVSAQAGIKGAAVGASLGATVGHLVGGNDEAWIGAALGAAGGTLIESSNEKHKKDIEASNIANGHNITYNNSESIKQETKIEAVIPEEREKTADTWGMRSEEEVKERMAREKANQEAWNKSF